MKKILVLILGVMLVFTISCKKQTKEAKEIEKAVKGIEELGKKMEQTAKEMEETKGKIEAVDFRVLKELLPEIKGWEKRNPRGEKAAFGKFGISNAEAEYALGEAEIRIKITDTAGYSMMIAPFSIFIQSGYEEEDEEHYKKTTTIKGFPAIEEFYPSQKRGTLTVIVKNRYIVEAEGSNIDKVNTLHDFLNTVDLKKLESL